MSHLETAFATQAYRGRCEDRVAVIGAGDRTVIVVADGAGGIGAGDLAATSVISEIKTRSPNVHSPDEWAEALRQVDCGIALGESTGVVVDVRPYGIAGASVGDSAAWIMVDDTIIDLTKNQVRKPLLGSGNAAPVSFAHQPLNGLLLVATDGFFDYVKPTALVELVARTDFQTLATRCIEMVRLPSGEYWDDVGIVVARVSVPHRTRTRYAI